jgi:hypothetical protein
LLHDLAVAEWHLRKLEQRLQQRGWQVIAVRDAESVQVSATWEVERGESRLLFDFFIDPELNGRAVEHAYAVVVRDHSGCGLYLGKKPTEARPNRPWEQDLTAFVAALDELQS